MYGDYLRAFGPRLTLLYFFVLFVLSGGSEIVSALWLSSWSTDTLRSEKNETLQFSLTERIAVFAGFGFGRCQCFHMSSALMFCPFFSLFHWSLCTDQDIRCLRGQHRLA